MHIIMGDCRSGKEVELLRMSARKNKHILCYSRARAEQYKQKAAELGTKIPEPIVYDDKRTTCR